MLDVNSPELKKIRKLLQIESTEDKKVAKTLLETPQVQIKTPQAQIKTQPVRKIAKTLLETNFPEIEPVKARTEPTAEIEPKSKQKRVEPPKQFVAKTLLDHSVLAETLNKYALRKSEQAAEVARDRAQMPASEFHPVEGKKLAQACAWRWEDETTDRFRYCPNCQTQAYNFDGLELADAEALIFTRESKRNPTLYKRVDGKFMTQDCPVQIKRKNRFVLFSIVAASVFLVLVTIAVLVLPPLAPKPTDATGDAIEQQSETDTGTPSKETGDEKTSDTATEVQKNSDGQTADGKRKRPTFGPEDVGSYWE